MKTLLASLLAALTATLLVACKPPARSAQAEVKRLTQPIVDAGLTPSLVVGIFDQGRTEVFGFGEVSPGSGRAPDGATIYEIGSVSKVFTSLLLADAVNRGELTLDTPLSELLPKGTIPPAVGGQQITPAHLATHTSGLPRDPVNIPQGSLGNASAPYTKAKLLAGVSGLTLAQAPGQKIDYSNLGMGLLGQLLADRAQSDYDTLLRDRISTPLSLSDTVVALSPDQKARAAPPTSGGTPATPSDFGALAGCGGIHSTVNDLLRFIVCHVDPASSPLAADIALVTTKRGAGIGPGGTSGLGWQYAADGTTLWHVGVTNGYTAAVFVNPTYRKGVVVLANSTDSLADQLAERIIQSLFGMKVEPPSIRSAARLSAAELTRITGEYPSAVGLTMMVTLENSVVFAKLTGQEALPIFPESATHFFYRAVPAELDFEIDASGGPAKSVILRQNGQTILFVRKR